MTKRGQVARVYRQEPNGLAAIPGQGWQSATGIQRESISDHVLIDHEGIVRYRASGMSFEREADLNDAIHKHIKILAKTRPSEE